MRARGALLVVLLLMAAERSRGSLLADYLPPGLPGYQTDRGVTVLTRLHPELEPNGIDWDGLIRLRPMLEQSVGFDTNARGAGGGAGGGGGSAGSAMTVTHPSLTGGAEGERYRIGLYADLTQTAYLAQPRQNRLDFTLGIGGGVDLGDGRLTASLFHLRAHQDRTQIGALPSDAPIGFDVDDGRVAYAFPFARWTLTPDIDVTRYRFQATSISGVPVAQSYRDRLVTQAGVTLSYELAPQRSLLAVLRGDATAYAVNTPGQPKRDSHGAGGAIGFDYDQNGIWRWKLLLGVATREYLAAVYGRHIAFVGEADFVWNPSGMTTVTAQISRTIEDAAQEGVGDFTYSSGRVQIDHELQRNLLLQLRGAVRLAQFQPGRGTQTIESLGLGVTWIINRTLRLAANYDHTATQSHQIGIAANPTDAPRDVALVTVRISL